jgi:hypothetical protein
MDAKQRNEREHADNERRANEMYGRSFDKLNDMEQREVVRRHSAGTGGWDVPARARCRMQASMHRWAPLAGSDPEPRHSTTRKGHESRGQEGIQLLFRDDNVQE